MYEVAPPVWVATSSPVRFSRLLPRSPPIEGPTWSCPPEALAFLKAWAAHVKKKLVDAGKDGRGYHATRRDGFLADVHDLLEDLLDGGRRPDEQMFEPLFGATGGQREIAVRRILEDTGWLA